MTTLRTSILKSFIVSYQLRISVRRLNSKPNSLISSGKNHNGSVGVRILAGITTGGMAVICAQPTDVVKVRMQAQGMNGGAIRYTGALQAYKMIAKQEGVKGLWKGK